VVAPGAAAPKAWVDGAVVEWGDAALQANSQSNFGVCAFEGIRAYARADGRACVFRLCEHVTRLFDTCRMLLLRPALDARAVTEGCLEVLRANQMSEAYLRPLVFPARGSLDIYDDQPASCVIMAWSWGSYAGPEGLSKGIRAKVSSFARQHVNAGLPKAKVMGQYVNSVLAKREARAAGYDEALMADTGGYVCEATTANLFVVKKGTLFTPDLANSVLEGITRDTIVQLAREVGVPVVEGRLTRDQVWLADEVFLTGTASEVTPVREVDDRQIGSGEVGPLTRALQERFFEVARGAGASHPHWLTPYEF
jgi:branched-chain amino acid aminotransferase